ncbi:MAG: hypothetical protein ACOYLO_07855 [Ferruginibacter sp.]|jgi:hypothetical protein
MKTILFTILFCFSAFIKNADAQTTGVPDTLAYLQTIVANKSQYIGQPFSVLLSNLQISIKFFSPFGSIPHDKTKETSTEFSFYFPQNANEIYLTYPSLRISWQPYLDNIHAHSLYNQYNGGWVPTVVSYYTSGIIADIQIRE